METWVLFFYGLRRPPWKVCLTQTPRGRNSKAEKCCDRWLNIKQQVLCSDCSIGPWAARLANRFLPCGSRREQQEQGRALRGHLAAFPWVRLTSPKGLGVGHHVFQGVPSPPCKRWEPRRLHWMEFGNVIELFGERLLGPTWYTKTMRSVTCRLVWSVVFLLKTVTPTSVTHPSLRLGLARMFNLP